MKIGAKLTFAFGGVILLIGISAIVSMDGYRKIHEEFELLKEDIIPGAIVMSEMVGRTHQIAHDAMDYMIAKEEEEEEEEVLIITGLGFLEKAGREHLEHERHIGEEEEKTAQELLEKIGRFNSGVMGIISLKKQGASIDELIEKEEKEVHTAMDALTKQLEEHVAIHMEELAKAEESVHKAHVFATRIVLLTTCLIIALSAAVASLITRSIVSPLHALHKGTEIIGQGNLDYKLASNAKDEVGQLSRAFDRMVEDLKVTTTSVNNLNKEISARKQAEEVLQQSEKKLRTITRSALDAIIMMDGGGNIAYWNPAAQKMFGYSSDEIIGKDVHEALAPRKYHEAYKKGIEGFKKTGQGPAVGKVLELTALRKDGSEFPMEISVSSIMVKGSWWAVAIIRDITERKQAEEQIQRYAAELEQANEELKTFTYAVSHDLRAPLLNMKGFAAELRFALELIGPSMNAALPHLDEGQRQAVTKALEEDVPEALDFIDSSAIRMDRFINALLKLSRLGRRELKLEPIDMHALVQATLKTLAHQIEERQVKVTVGHLPEMVTDRISMEQIMGNILDNAVKYLDPGRPGEIEITAERGDDETTFRVRDNGRGISEEDIDKVFALFRRAGRQDIPGEGMGLLYVQTLVRRHGGRIWCESKLGVGTTFTFTISNYLEKGGENV